MSMDDVPSKRIPEENSGEHCAPSLDSKDIVTQLRASAAPGESAPTVRDPLWAPKEMSARRSAWVVRGVMVILALVLAADVLLLYRNPSQVDTFSPEGGPPVKVFPTPALMSLPAPPTEGKVAGEAISEGGLFPTPQEEIVFPDAPPTPTVIPLPEGVEEIEFPTPDA